MSYLLTYNGHAVQRFQDEHKHTSPIKRQVWRWGKHWGYVYPGVSWDNAWVAETRNEVASLWTEKEQALLETVEESVIQAPPFEVDDLWIEEILNDQQIQCGSALYIRGTLSEIIETAKSLGMPTQWFSEVKPQPPQQVPGRTLAQRQQQPQAQAQAQAQQQQPRTQQPQGRVQQQQPRAQREQLQQQPRVQQEQQQEQQQAQTPPLQPYRTAQKTNGQVLRSESSQRPSSRPLRPSSQQPLESRPQAHREHQQWPERPNQQRFEQQASRSPLHNAQQGHVRRPAPAPEPYLFLD